MPQLSTSLDMFIALRERGTCTEMSSGPIALLLDFAKAYDSLNREYIIATLRRYGFPPRFCAMVESIHHGTTGLFLVNGYSSFKLTVSSVIHIIALLNKCFTKILICTKTNETLYDHLKEVVDGVEIHEEGNVPMMSEYDSETSKLILFDDLVLERKRTQAQIGQYFIRGRKQGWSMVYISQSYFGVPKTIRINAQYVILGRNLTQRDLGIICRDFPTDMSVKDFIDLYKRLTDEKLTTMMDIIHRKIYRNVTELICDM